MDCEDECTGCEDCEGAFTYFSPQPRWRYEDAPAGMRQALERIRSLYADPINTLVGEMICQIGLGQDYLGRWMYSLELGRSVMLCPTTRTLIGVLRNGLRTIRRARLAGSHHYYLEKL